MTNLEQTMEDIAVDQATLQHQYPTVRESLKLCIDQVLCMYPTGKWGRDQTCIDVFTLGLKGSTSCLPAHTSACSKQLKEKNVSIVSNRALVQSTLHRCEFEIKISEKI